MAYENFLKNTSELTNDNLKDLRTACVEVALKNRGFSFDLLKKSLPDCEEIYKRLLNLGLKTVSSYVRKNNCNVDDEKIYDIVSEKTTRIIEKLFQTKEAITTSYIKTSYINDFLDYSERSSKEALTDFSNLHDTKDPDNTSGSHDKNQKKALVDIIRKQVDKFLKLRFDQNNGNNDEKIASIFNIKDENPVLFLHFIFLINGFTRRELDPFYKEMKNRGYEEFLCEQKLTEKLKETLSKAPNIGKVSRIYKTFKNEADMCKISAQITSMRQAETKESFNKIRSDIFSDFMAGGVFDSFVKQSTEKLPEIYSQSLNG